MKTNVGDVTALLHDWKNGDRHAENRLFEVLMPDLQQIARHQFSKERSGHTLQTTALINEAFMKLTATKQVDWQDRGHFLAVAARVMRRHLIDHWRTKTSAQLISLEGFPNEWLVSYSQPLDLIIELDIALDELELHSKLQRTIVELKFYLGLNDEESAASLDLSVRTLQREWFKARTWLFERLKSGPCPLLTKTTTA